MKNSELLNDIVQNAIDGIISINAEGIVQSINPSACKLFGYLPEEVIGNNISMLMPTPDSLQHDHYIRRYHVTSKPRIIGIGREVNGLRRDGTIFPMRLGVSEVKYHDEVFYVGFIHDLSNQKEAEERLKDYTLHLEELVEVRTQSLNETILALEIAKEQISNSLESEKELNQLKSRFISMASHEFRTPLSTIQLSASLIDKYSQQFGFPEISKHANKIKASVTGLTAILNNFLQIEKLESGKIEAQFTYFDLKELALEVADEMQSLAKAGQKIIYRNLTEKTGVNLDRNLIKNCMINLITNAIKYSNEGSLIEFNTDISERENIISVKDNGIGIPAEDQKYLFGAFFRAQNTGSILGTGLGLNIVARHVELMKGKIEFESNPENGTLFKLIFPLL